MGIINGFDNAELKFDHFELIPKQEMAQNGRSFFDEF